MFLSVLFFVVFFLVFTHVFRDDIFSFLIIIIFYIIRYFMGVSNISFFAKEKLMSSALSESKF